ncbi:D-alanyl-D-alanine carboxypeptidase family protein [Microbacterium sp. NPDC091313]
MTTQQDAPDGVTEISDWMRDGRTAAEYLPDPRTRRRRRLVGWLVFLAVILLVGGSAGGYTLWALTAPAPPAAATTRLPSVATRAPVSIPMPAQGSSAVAVAGADAYLGPDAATTWLTSGSGDAVPIASITKLVTALVILQRHPLAGADDAGPTITFDKAAHDLYDRYYVLGATIAPMPTGSRMSLRDALTAMLVPSASNYADALSTWAFGSRGAFLGAARAWLADHGLDDTRIFEPTGIDSRNVSTPADLLALGKIAAADPVVSRLASLRSASLGDAGNVASTNTLLGVDGITGLKTGNLGENSYALLYTASVDVGIGEPLQVTGVVLGGFSRETVSADVREQLGGLRRGFEAVQVAAQGDEVGRVSTPWGASARLVIGGSVSIRTWSDTPITVSMQTSEPAEYRDGELVGSITWTSGPNTVSAPIVVSGDIAAPTDWWRLTHPDQLGR